MSKSKIAAVIDIGSSAVRLHISQWNGHKVTSLDKLEKPTQIGKEVFSTGYISFDTVRSLSAILGGFCEKAREYGITSIHTIASTALREASNQAYILDHLLTRNKIDVQVLEDTEVSALLIGALKNEDYSKTKKTLLVYGGTGTTDFELIGGEEIILAHSIQTGLLKIAEMLNEAADFSRHIDCMAEEYLNTFLMRKNRIQDLFKADGILFGAADIQPLCRLFGVDSECAAINIENKKVLEIYETYRSVSVPQICHKYGLHMQQGEILYAMLTFLTALLHITKSKKLACAQISLADAMLNLILTPGARRRYDESLRTGAITSALDLAARYCSDMNHCGYVAGVALTLFEKLRKGFGFFKKQNLFLNIACLLHESGHYTNCDDMQEASFDLVKDAHIYGLCSRETLLTANIIAPQSLLGVARSAPRASMLNDEEVLFAAKMHALLHLSDTLDFSHKQKAKLLGVKL